MTADPTGLSRPVVAWVAVSAVCLVASSATAWQQDISDHGVGLHWKTVAPYPMIASRIPGVADNGQAALQRAVAIWQANCSGMRWAEPSTGWIFPIVHWADSWPFGPGDAAYTQRFSDADSGRLRSVVIHLNGAYTFAGPRSDGKGADLDRVLAHELGHVLGIGHSRHRDALMFASILPGQATATHLGPDDKTALCSLYPDDVQLLPAQAGMAFASPPRRSSVRNVTDDEARLPSWMYVAAVAFLLTLAGAVIFKFWRR